MNSRKNLLVEELRATNESAIKNFRICIILLGLLFSSLGYVIQTNGNGITTFTSEWSFYFGFGLLFSSIFLSIVISIDRWSSNTLIDSNPAPDSIEESKDNPISELRKALERNKVNLMIAQMLLLFSITSFGYSIQESLDLETGKFLLIALPIILTGSYLHMNEKILEKLRAQ
ncbi:hypothetical protein SVXNc_0170 [Candidatus Nanohalococcus occultus]|uniref:DUF2178 domain-containing protein n=2 Tax=Candidatus Nanohalococcus occultus TaxID=2978047 RepID=A0ABY8CDA0_9ARCH|nr:hypothetical protein SVXNc_0170 [Candidatus Nanohaloarchaeota archaeon SVXNc]